MTELALVGPGVLGRTIALSLPQERYTIGPVLSHSKVSSRRAVRETKRGFAVQGWADLAGVKTILVAVSQDQLADALEHAAADLPTLDGRRFLLTGVASRPVIRQVCRLEAAGAHVGGLLPIGLYRRPSIVAAKTSFAVWGSQKALGSARRLVNAMGGIHSVIEAKHSAQALLGVALVSGVLNTSLELGIRRLVRAGFPRNRALEALAPVADSSVQEHRHSRHQAPTRWFPTTCPELVAASREADQMESLLCEASLRLACEELE